MFSTRDPPSVQRIPWPTVDQDFNDEVSEAEYRRTLSGHDTWILNDNELPWLISPNGMLLIKVPFGIY